MLFCLGLGIALPRGPLVIWPISTMLLGLACGLAVFGHERSGGYERLLGAQRLTPGTLWTVKGLFWIAIAFAGAALIWAIGITHQTLLNASDHNAGNLVGRVVERWLGDGGVARTMNLPLFLTTWVVHGFAFGVVYGLAAKRTIAALILATATSCLVLGFWVPSVILGGLAVWQVLLFPLALLLTSRLVMWPWISDRLYSLQPLTGLVACGLLGGLWVAGSLWYRAVEVPDLGQPFDVEAYLKSLPPPEKNESGRLIREATRDFVQLQKSLDTKLGPPRTRLFPNQDDEAARLGESRLSYEALVWEILERGWPKDDKEIARWLDLMFEGRWAQDIRTAVSLPLGVVFDPRTIDLSSRLDELQPCREIANCFIARALQLSARGDHKAALEHWTLVLGLSRQLANDAPAIGYLVAQSLQNTALGAVSDNLQRLAHDAHDLRFLLTALQHHERTFPALENVLKAEYIVYHNSDRLLELGRPADDTRRVLGPDGILFKYALLAPWEKERHVRLRRALAAAPFAPPQLHKERDKALSRHEQVARSYGLLQPQGAAARLDAEQWGRLIARSATAVYENPLISHALTRSELRGVVNVRTAELQIALLLYELQEGLSAGKLHDLVPRYLPAVPIDPLSGQPFKYRVSKGEEITVRPTEGNVAIQQVPAGQGIIFTEGDDAITVLVPMWSKKK
jgi:hypothetical protein